MVNEHDFGRFVALSLYRGEIRSCSAKNSPDKKEDSQGTEGDGKGDREKGG